jgi:hypothetical protein
MSTGDQSGGLYLGADSFPGVAAVSISWNKKLIATFRALHSGHAHVVPGGAQYAHVTVTGIPAYWLVSSPVIGHPIDPSVLSISALKSGYVVTLESHFLSRSQAERVMASLLHNL